MVEITNEVISYLEEMGYEQEYTAGGYTYFTAPGEQTIRTIGQLEARLPKLYDGTVRQQPLVVSSPDAFLI